MSTENVEATIGEGLANSFRPFLSPGLESVSAVDEAVINMGKAINSAFLEKRKLSADNELITRASQFLSCIDYGTLTDYQKSVVELLEKAIKNETE